MKIICNRNDLLEVFGVINSVVPTKSTIPVLQNIKLQTDGNSLSVIGTDLEVGIKSEITAEVKEKGSLLIPNIRLGTILRETTDDNIKIESQNHVTCIITRDAEYKIIGADPVDYPDFPDFDNTKAIEIDNKGLKEMIYKTIFAISGEVSRYALTGLLLEIKKKEIRIVGSDGKRLAYAKRQSEQSITQDKRVIIPAKGMSLLERVIKDDHELRLVLEENQIKINLTPTKEKQTKTLIFSRLVEGTFPDYETIIPTGCDKVMEVKAEELHTAFRRANVVTTDKFKATKLIFKDNKLTLLSRTQDVGEARVEITVKYQGQPFESVFNPDFFIDVLRVLGEGDITIEFKDKLSPAVFKKGRDYIYLVMPMTIDI